MRLLEKLIEEFTNRQNLEFFYFSKQLIPLEDVIRVIKKYQDGNENWIPCSERLPEEGESVTITDTRGRVYHDISYGLEETFDKENPCFHKWDDEYWQCFKYDAIAWQPSPDAYQSKQ